MNQVAWASSVRSTRPARRTQHLYTYVGNNPVNLVDPTGHWGEGLKNWWGGIKEDAVTMATGVIDNWSRRYNDAISTPSFSTITNYLTFGMVERSVARATAMKENPSFFNVANAVTWGYADTVKRAFAPEKAFSLDHILSSLGFALSVVGAYSTVTKVAATRANINAWENSTKNTPSSAFENNNPLDDIQYTEKVVKQMKKNDYHGFPDIVDNYGTSGSVSYKLGGDGIMYKHVNISGVYKGSAGRFEYIIKTIDKTCNHRMFTAFE